MAEKKKQQQNFSVLNSAELKNELAKTVEHRAKLEFQHRVSPLKNPTELALARRNIARLKTFIRLKEAAK